MRALAFALALAAPAPALALSCVAPSVPRTFNEADAAAEEYVVVHGRITLDEAELPAQGTTDQNPPKMTRLPAHLEGLSLTREGFAMPFEKALTLEVACYGPWCGSIGNGADVLAFVRREEGRYSLAINPCGGHAFAEPKPAHLDAAERCMTGDCPAR